MPNDMGSDGLTPNRSDESSRAITDAAPKPFVIPRLYFTQTRDCTISRQATITMKHEALGIRALEPLKTEEASVPTTQCYTKPPQTL